MQHRLFFSRLSRWGAPLAALGAVGLLSVSAATLAPETPSAIKRQLQSAPHDPALLATLGAMQRQTHDYEGAAQTYAQLLSINPDDERARNLLVLVLYQAAQTRKPAQALPLLRRAVRLAPEAQFLQPVYMETLRQCGADSELVEAFQEIPDKKSLSIPMLLAVADACRTTHHPSTAAAVYRFILARTPSDPDAGLGLAMALLEERHYADALDAIQHAIDLHPERPDLLLTLANIQWQSGAYVTAVDTLDRILILDPGNADAINEKAQLLCDMGCISLAADVVRAYPNVVWAHIRNRVETLTAEAHTTWHESDLSTNTLPKSEPDDLLALCYYNVTDQNTDAPVSISTPRFLQQIEYLRTHDYHFVSAADVAAARRGETPLPNHAVLLTFDHGYVGFLKQAMPILELYEVPVIVSVCPAWIENGPPIDPGAPLMTWQDISTLAGNRLVTLGLEAEGLFELVCANPQGDVAFSAVTRIYNAAAGRYETEADQQARITATLKRALHLMYERVGTRPRVLVWSHGARNGPAASEAVELGFALQLGLRARPQRTNTEQLERIPILQDLPIGPFISLVKPMPPSIETVRAVALAMDAIDARTDAIVDRRVRLIIQRLSALGANTVILQACADRDGNGNAEAAYFPTTQLPVLHDTLDHVVAGLQGAGFRVFIELPVLSFEHRNTPQDDAMRVMEAQATGAHPSFSLQERYSPFHPDVVAWTTRLYRDLAEHVRCDGIVFGDDAYLTDREDFSKAARDVFSARIETPIPDSGILTKQQEAAWVQIKTDTLNRLTLRLGDEVKRYRPNCALVRSIYSPLLHHPQSKHWFAQNYAEAVRLYDYVLLAAYVEMEDIRRPDSWLRKLVDLADNRNNGLEKTIFKLQARDWGKRKPVSAAALRSRFRTLARRGALHMAYGPDSPLTDTPSVRSMDRALAEPTHARK